MMMGSYLEKKTKSYMKKYKCFNSKTKNKTLALEESKRTEMHLLEEEKYMKIREEENHKMKQELMRLKLEAQTLKL